MITKTTTNTVIRAPTSLQNVWVVFNLAWVFSPQHFANGHWPHQWFAVMPPSWGDTLTANTHTHMTQIRTLCWQKNTASSVYRLYPHSPDHMFTDLNRLLHCLTVLLRLKRSQSELKPLLQEINWKYIKKETRVQLWKPSIVLPWHISRLIFGDEIYHPGQLIWKRYGKRFLWICA